MKIIRFLSGLAFLVLASCQQPAFAAECASAPLGLPTIVGAELVCHPGYASLLDPSIKETRLVTYQLTAQHAIAGCIPRTGLSFHADPLAPATDQARASDYAGSGMDLGHMADNEDFAWDKDEQADTFSMANVEPQLPGLNRQGWESGEDMVRAWAYAFGPVDVFIGPIFKEPSATIGPEKIKVPGAFFKVVYVPATNSVLSFEMPQQPVAKMADITPFIVPLAKVEADAGFALPIPAGAIKAVRAWPTNISVWRKAHVAACAH